MKYKFAILDFDGTLADSFPWFLKVINDVADKYRFRRIRDDEIASLRCSDNREIIKHLGIPFWKMPLIIRHMKKRMAQDIGGISLFPGAGQMLKDLAAAGVTLAIVTSNSEANVRAILGVENSSLIKYFACDSRLFGKTSKIKKVLRQSGEAETETICIGDELRDLHSARALNIDFGAVAWGYADSESFTPHSPEHKFLNIREIAEKLLAENSPV